MKDFKISSILLITTVLLTTFLLWRVSPLHGSDNDMSRLAGVIAVSRYRELPIDKTIHRITLDRVEYKGHKYSSKPPVLHVVLGEIIHYGFYVKPVLLDNAVAIYRTSTALSTVFPLVGIFILFYYLTRKHIKLSEKRAIITSLFLVLGTLLFTYSRYLTNHVLEAFLQLSLFTLLMSEHNKKVRMKAVSYGFLLSAITVIDLTYGFVVIPITLIYLFLCKREFFKRAFILMVLSSVPLLTLHFYLNWVQFGTFLPPQLFKEKYLSYPGSKWIGDVTGMEAQNHRFLLRFFNYTIGSYGLFLYQPVLIFALAYKKFKKNPLWIYVISITSFYILFNAVMQPNYGGSSFGPRRFLPLIPMLMYFVVKNYSKTAIKERKIFYATIIITVLLSLLGVFNTWGNWDYFMRIDESRDFYFPILYSFREVLRKYQLEHLLDFTYQLHF